MKIKYLPTILVMMIFIGGFMGVVAAVSDGQLETYSKMTSFMAKLKYSIFHGFFLFSSWGQANCCDEYPQEEVWISKFNTLTCASRCGTGICALDAWYSDTVYLGGGSPSGDPDWNNYIGETHGDGAFFSCATSGHEWCYVQVYCCPEEEDCQIDDHSTDLYVCTSGGWDKKSAYDYDESCSWSDEDRCWCADEDDNFYIDESDLEHCRSSPRDEWCAELCTSHDYKDCYSNDIYWYDSCDVREGKSEECESEGCDAGDTVCNLPGDDDDPDDDVPDEDEDYIEHASYECDGEDIYWYDSNDLINDKKVECGEDGCALGSQTCDVPSQTCLEIDGEECSSAQICSTETFTSATDTDRCCVGGNCIIGEDEVPDNGDDVPDEDEDDEEGDVMDWLKENQTIVILGLVGFVILMVVLR